MSAVCGRDFGLYYLSSYVSTRDSGFEMGRRP